MRRIQDFRLLIVAAALAVVAGCTPEEKPAAARTLTVGELLHDGALFDQTRVFCKDNPAERQSLPNCVNVSQAAYRKGLLPCFGGGVIDHACLEQRGYKR